MEPRSIQNLNGRVSLLPKSPPNGTSNLNGTPRSISLNFAVLSPTKEFLNLPDTPGSKYKSPRRKSTLWERSPSSDGDVKDEVEPDLMLSPVPATPAPETVSAYAEHVLDGEVDGAETPYFLRREELVQRTCPPKRSEVETEGAGVGMGMGLGMHGVDGEVRPGGNVLMQRLLLARRKSLQWAPKVGSPLARS
jgi:hypothetical protein